MGKEITVMANVAVQKVKKVGPESLPIFETIETAGRCAATGI
jgi:hypothetical protein